MGLARIVSPEPENVAHRHGGLARSRSRASRCLRSSAVHSDHPALVQSSRGLLYLQQMLCDECGFPVDAPVHAARPPALVSAYFIVPTTLALEPASPSIGEGWSRSHRAGLQPCGYRVRHARLPGRHPQGQRRSRRARGRRDRPAPQHHRLTWPGPMGCPVVIVRPGLRTRSRRSSRCPPRQAGPAPARAGTRPPQRACARSSQWPCRRLACN